jgi:O-antigen ligase
MGGQLLEQMALAIGAGVLVRPPSEIPSRIGGPAAIVAAISVASAAAMIISTVWLTPHDGGTRALLQQSWDRTAAQRSSVWAPAFAATTAVACGFLAWAVERTLRDSPHLVPSLVATALIGHACAAALNVQAVVAAAISTGNVLEALPRLFMTIRVSVQTDWNAGASALLLAGVAGFGLVTGHWARRAMVSLLMMIIAAGLWATSSRAAIVMAVVACVAGIGWSVWSAVRLQRSSRLAIVGVAVVALSAGAWLAAHYPAGRNDNASRTIRSRLVLMKAGLQMFQAAPVFGIGITRFYTASAESAGPALATFGLKPRENAHNNFVQILAEQGLVGFCALLWWLSVVVLGGLRAQLSNPTPVRAGVLAGIMACIGTWLTGHPLLVPEFALVFWFYCGILTGTLPASAPGHARWLPLILVSALLVSIAPRAQALRDAGDFEHLGFGLSLWQHDDAQRYREAGTEFQIFLPAGDRPVAVPVRRAPGAPEILVVEVRIRGQLVNSVLVGGDSWTTIVVMVPPKSRRFELVDFLVRPQATSSGVPAVLLRVGKAVAR